MYLISYVSFYLFWPSNKVGRLVKLHRIYQKAKQNKFPQICRHQLLTFSELLIKEDGTLIEEGDIITRPKLARTLSIIADDPTAYYDPSKQLARDIVADIQEAGNTVTFRSFGFILKSRNVYDGNPCVKTLALTFICNLKICLLLHGFSSNIFIWVYCWFQCIHND